MADDDCICSCCLEPFEKIRHGFKRRGLHSQLKGGPSAAQSLENCYNITVTPDKAIFICTQCSTTIRSLEIKTTQLGEVEQKFRKIRKPGSYMATKLPITPTHRQGVKRLKTISSKVQTHKKGWTPKKSKQKAVSVTVANTEIGTAVQLINQRKYRYGLQKLISNSKSARNAATQVFTGIVRKELHGFAKASCRSTESGILDFNWESIIQQAKKLCPVMLELVTASLTRKHYHKSATKRKGPKIVSLLPIIGTLICVMGFTRNRLCNSLQQMISMMLWLGGTKRKVFGNFNKLGLCQNVETTRQQVDNLRRDFDSTVMAWKDSLTKANMGIHQQPTESLPELEDAWAELEDVFESASDADSEPHTETDVPAASPDSPLTSESEQEKSTSADSADSQITPLDSLTIIDDAVSSSSSNSVSVQPPTESTHLYYDITFDNVNQKIGMRHHVRGKKNVMLNMVQAYASLERTCSFGLSEVVPSAQAIRDIPVSSFLPTMDDQLALKDELSVMVARILTSYMPAFKDLHTMASIPHQYDKESTHKSQIVPLGILNKDETKVSETIEILENYTKYIAKDKNGEPLNLLVFCDGLSCERVEGAKRARINGEDKWSRLDMFEPAIQEWHKRLMYIQDTYDELFIFDSHREKGTLFNLKQWFDHTGVSKNIMQCFDKAEELLDFATHCYTILCAMEIMQLDRIDDSPASLPESMTEKITYLNDLAIKVVELCQEVPDVEAVLNSRISTDATATEYCLCKLDLGGIMIYCNNEMCKRGIWFHLECLGLEEDDVPEGDWFCSKECQNQKVSGKKSAKVTTANKFQDGKLEYVNRLLWRGLNNIARHDSVRENDGERMIRHWKYDMLDFHERNHPKYFIFGHRLLANVAGAASERVRHNLIWERTVNVVGGRRRNVPKDLHCEHLNREYKDSCRVSTGQLTNETVNRHSQMLGIGRIIENTFAEKVVSRKVYPRKHTQVDRSNDLRKMVQVMQKQRLFKEQRGRYFKGFENFSRPTCIKRPMKLKQKLIDHLKGRAALRELTD